jgi:predicted PurR-regulated permease PerM
MSGFVLLLYLGRNALATVLLAIFISTALDGIVYRLEKWKIPRLIGTIMVFVSGLSIILGLLAYVIPIAIVELKGLFISFGDTTAELFDFDTALQLHITELIETNLNNISNFLRSPDASIFDIAQKVMGSATFVLATLVVSFYLTASKDGVARFLRAVFPAKLEDKVLSIYYRSKRKIEYWVQAQFILGVIVGSMVFIGLMLGDVKYKFLLAILAGVFELIPIVGPILAGAVAVVVALSQSPGLGMYVVLLFLVIQQIENNILVPVVMKRAINVHPVVILIALLGGYQVGGITGMLLAVPAAVVSQELIDDWIALKSRDREDHDTEKKDSQKHEQ